MMVLVAKWDRGSRGQGFLTGSRRGLETGDQQDGLAMCLGTGTPSVPVSAPPESFPPRDMQTLSVSDVPDKFTPRCSVVICTRDRPAELDRCLEAVQHLDYPRFDVLVVDNASRDARPREVAARRGFRYVVEPVVGLSRARNSGARHSNADIVAFLDDDSVPASDWLARLVVEFKDPQVMAVTGRILPLNAAPSQERAPSLPGGLDLGEERRAVDAQNPDWFRLANFGGIGNGGNMAYRHKAFDVWPGFDERIGHGTPLRGCEEHYAFFLLIERGYRVIYAPQAVVYHPFPGTLEDLRSRHLRNLGVSCGYMTLLFLEHRRHRGAILRYVAQWLKGDSRTWRWQLSENRRITPRWRELLACVPGPLLYFRALLQRGLRRNSDRPKSSSET